MIVALVNGKLTRAEHGKPANCPECQGDLYARLPERAIRHWAHKPLPDGQTRDCSRDAGEMTEWHRAWQDERAKIDPTCVEVDGEGFRADAKNAAGHVIEFQHSSIKDEEVKRREQYWRKGCWVADGLPDEREQARLERLPDKQYTDNYWRFKWSPMPKLIYVAKWPVWIDFGERGLLQVQSASQGRGGGWLVERDWFIDEILNGTRLTLKAHIVASQTSRPKTKRATGTATDEDEDLSDIPIHCLRVPIAEPPVTNPPPQGVCTYWENNAYCGNPNTRQFMNGRLCIAHWPASIRNAELTEGNTHG